MLIPRLRFSTDVVAKTTGLWIATLAAVLLTACGSSPTPERDEAIEKDFLRKGQSDQQQREAAQRLPGVMIRFDQAMDEYVKNIQKSENDRALKRAEAIGKWLEQNAIRYKTELLRMLQDPQERNRTIAAGALGFTHQDDVVAPLLNTLDDEDPNVRTSACFGLATVASTLTPLDRLNELLLDPEEPMAVRQSAAWALLRLQVAGVPPDNFRSLWPMYVRGDPIAKDPVLLIHSLRGLGLLRDPSMVDPILPYLSHPRPKVRMAAMIAVGRSGNRSAAKHLFPFLTDRETNPNVRLTARKALKALTGNQVDHEYDLRAWKAEFSDR